MRHLSLAEVLKVHRDQGHKPLSFAPKGGEFDVAMYTVPDAELAASDPMAWKSGKRVYREVKHNLVTRWFSEDVIYWDVPGTKYVFLSPEDDQPHLDRQQYRTSTASPGQASASSFDIDTVSRLWTITGTILAPAAGKIRTFQSVGVSIGDGYQAGGNSAANVNVVAATRLSSPRTQDETQQVVVSYRLAWEDGSNV